MPLVTFDDGKSDLAVAALGIQSFGASQRKEVPTEETYETVKITQLCSFSCWSFMSSDKGGVGRAVAETVAH